MERRPVGRWKAGMSFQPSSYVGHRTRFLFGTALNIMEKASMSLPTVFANLRNDSEWHRRQGGPTPLFYPANFDPD